MKRYSIFALAREAAQGRAAWERAWADAAPKPAYDAVIVGGGGHGLATAYYLAKHHGIRDVAVLEKGWIGGGNTGRNTTIIRSNYLDQGSADLYELSRELFETLSQELNFNVMFSPRGVVTLAQTPGEVRAYQRLARVARLNGIDARWMDAEETRRRVPLLADALPAAALPEPPRFPALGALWQPRGGVARHDAVAWGYARAASALGVDIIQNCAVEGVEISGGRVVGLRTSRGAIRTGRVGLVAAGSSSVVAEMAGFRLPLRSVTLQALVSEPVKPCLDVVVMSNALYGYVSQSDKGEMVIAGAADSYVNYSQRGGFAEIESVVAGLQQILPFLGRLRMLRRWGGTVDLTPDRSPIIGPSPVAGIFLNCGWGTGGFKATPGSGHCFAATLARGAPDPVAAPFGLERFAEGRMIDESAAAGAAH